MVGSVLFTNNSAQLLRAYCLVVVTVYWIRTIDPRSFALSTILFVCVATHHRFLACGVLEVSNSIINDHDLHDCHFVFYNRKCGSCSLKYGPAVL